MQRMRGALLFGTKPHKKMFFTETTALSPSFIEEMRREEAVSEQSRVQ
jgi:hypothetical protein